MNKEKWSFWKRNVIDSFKNKTTEEIKETLRETAFNYAVLMEHWNGDFNISTMVRNANAFNAKEVFYIGKKRWDKRAPVGTHHYTPLSHLSALEDVLALKEKYTFIAFDNNIEKYEIMKLDEFDWTRLEKPPLMIFGEEGEGVTSTLLEWSDYVLEIPQYGSVRSLNVGTSSGIAMYDYVKKSKAPYSIKQNR